MKIIKYQKLKNGKYEILLENGEKLKVFEDIILKENLLWKKEIANQEDLMQKNNQYAIMDTALKRIAHHVESKKSLSDYLSKKGYCAEDIQNVLQELMMKGYLDDTYYAKCYINDHINLSNDGPLKIINHLESMKISKDIYLPFLDGKDNIWQEKIQAYIAKNLKSNKKSLYIFKNKMLINLVNLGYEKEMVNAFLNQVKLENSEELKKQAEEKIRLKLSKKYAGSELEYKIKEKLYQKGFFE